MPRQTLSHRREYERRVNRVMDYVQAHLAEELSLEKLADVAAFSPFHFHRIFSAITGETLSDFIRRIRLERAASALSVLHETSVLDIALRCGFSSAATFARAFKSHFGMSATAWREGGARQWRDRRQARRPRKTDRKPRKALPAPNRQGPAMTVRIEDLPPYRVAYVRHVGPYGDGGISALWVDFERWIRAQGLRQPGTLTIGIGHDAPTIAAADRLRYDACLVVDPQYKADRTVNIADLPGGKYAIMPFEAGRPTS
ncbi:MAG: AraC family transcriptional regulator [Pseudomonadota bacterium]